MNFLLIAILFLAAFIASLFGVGGGVLYTPFQLWLGIHFYEAAATSLLLILITSISSTIVYRHSHRVDWSLALILEVPTTMGAYLGGILSRWFSTYILASLLVLILIIAAWLMIRPLNFQDTFGAHIEKKKISKWSWQRNWQGKMHSFDLRYVFPVMFVIGALISSVGISGGVLKVPLMVLFFKVPMSIAVGSSAFMVGLTATAGFLGHATVGHVNWQVVLFLALPIFIGAQLGSRLSVHIQTQKLRGLYGWFLLLVALITFLRVLQIG